MTDAFSGLFGGGDDLGSTIPGSPGLGFSPGGSPGPGVSPGFSPGPFEIGPGGSPAPGTAPDFGGTPTLDYITQGPIGGQVGGVNPFTGVNPPPQAQQTAVPQPISPVKLGGPPPALSLEAAADPIPNASGDLPQTDASTMQGQLGNQPWWQKLLGGNVDSGPLPEGVSAQGGTQGGVLGQIAGGPTGDLLKTGVGAASIIRALMQGDQLPKGANQLRDLAGTQAALAKTYGAEAQAEGQGLLPAGAQALIQQNLDASIASIRTKYSQMGMSGSSAEVQDINAARNEALAQTFAIGQQLAQTGLNEVSSASGMEQSILEALMNAEMGQQSALGEALAGFAGASTDAQRQAA